VFSREPDRLLLALVGGVIAEVSRVWVQMRSLCSRGGCEGIREECDRVRENRFGIDWRKGSVYGIMSRQLTFGI